ncbi:MAG TPA: hypothetical protein VMB73_11835 [Acetobacteraceae bacterium]|nr:hypothetical protein [Acetobacteraceae bacterium]
MTSNADDRAMRRRRCRVEWTLFVRLERRRIAIGPIDDAKSRTSSSSTAGTPVTAPGTYLRKPAGETLFSDVMT